MGNVSEDTMQATPHLAEQPKHVPPPGLIYLSRVLCGPIIDFAEATDLQDTPVQSTYFAA